jgi:hypothetical protein
VTGNPTDPKGSRTENLRDLEYALEDAADMLHECALECIDCDYGNGATGKTLDGAVCEECAPIREAERRAREHIPLLRIPAWIRLLQSVRVSVLVIIFSCVIIALLLMGYGESCSG